MIAWAMAVRTAEALSTHEVALDAATQKEDQRRKGYVVMAKVKEQEVHY